MPLRCFAYFLLAAVLQLRPLLLLLPVDNKAQWPAGWQPIGAARESRVHAPLSRALQPPTPGLHARVPVCPRLHLLLRGLRLFLLRLCHELHAPARLLRVPHQHGVRATVGGIVLLIV